MSNELTIFLQTCIERMSESTELAFASGIGIGAVATCGAYVFGNTFLKRTRKTNNKLESAETNRCHTLHSVVGTWGNNKTYNFPLRKIAISIKKSKYVMEALNHINTLDYSALTKYCTQGFAIHHVNSTTVSFVGMTDLSDTPLEFTLLVDSCGELFDGRWLLSSTSLENQYGKFKPKDGELLISSMLECNIYQEEYIPSLWETFSRDEANLYFQEIINLAAKQIEDEYNNFKELLETEIEQEATIDSKKQTWGFKCIPHNSCKSASSVS